MESRVRRARRNVGVRLRLDTSPHIAIALGRQIALTLMADCRLIQAPSTSRIAAMYSGVDTSLKCERRDNQITSEL